MKCPYCPPRDDRGIRELHAHLAEAHPDQIRFDDLGDRAVYAVICPYCDQQYRQPMRKSATNTEFVAEFDHQIRLVAFDMLINHVLAEHEHTTP